MVMVWAMVVPEPGPCPKRLGLEADAVQVKVVPGTEERTCIEEVCWEHMVCAGGVKKTSGDWTTVTVRLVTGPVHPLADGVI